MVCNELSPLNITEKNLWIYHHFKRLFKTLQKKALPWQNLSKNTTKIWWSFDLVVAVHILSPTQTTEFLLLLMEGIRLTCWLVVHRIIYKVSYIPGSRLGFLPSTAKQRVYGNLGVFCHFGICWILPLLCLLTRGPPTRRDPLLLCDFLLGQARAYFHGNKHRC